jgi:hypothetical protein
LVQLAAAMDDHIQPLVLKQQQGELAIQELFKTHAPEDDLELDPETESETTSIATFSAETQKDFQEKLAAILADFR